MARTLTYNELIELSHMPGLTVMQKPPMMVADFREWDSIEIASKNHYYTFPVDNGRYGKPIALDTSVYDALKEHSVIFLLTPKHAFFAIDRYLENYFKQYLSDELLPRPAVGAQSFHHWVLYGDRFTARIRTDKIDKLAGHFNDPSVFRYNRFGDNMYKVMIDMDVANKAMKLFKLYNVLIEKGCDINLSSDSPGKRLSYMESIELVVKYLPDFGATEIPNNEYK